MRALCKQARTRFVISGKGGDSQRDVQLSLAV